MMIALRVFPVLIVAVFGDVRLDGVPIEPGAVVQASGAPHAISVGEGGRLWLLDALDTSVYVHSPTRLELGIGSIAVLDGQVEVHTNGFFQLEALDVAPVFMEASHAVLRVREGRADLQIFAGAVSWVPAFAHGGVADPPGVEGKLAGPCAVAWSTESPPRLAAPGPAPPAALAQGQQPLVPLDSIPLPPVDTRRARAAYRDVWGDFAGGAGGVGDAVGSCGCVEQGPAGLSGTEWGGGSQPQVEPRE